MGAPVVLGDESACPMRESHDREAGPYAATGDEAAVTRVELAELTGMSRTNIVERVGELMSLGLITESGSGPSTGGRAPRQFRLNAGAAAVLAIELGMTSVDVAVTNLLGEPVVSESHDWSINTGPDETPALVEESAERLLARHQVAKLPLVGAGIGFPGPVQVSVGRPFSPPAMPSWDGYPIADRLSARFGVDAWVDNEANLVALGEFRSGAAQLVDDFILVKVGSGMGAALPE